MHDVHKTSGQLDHVTENFIDSRMNKKLEKTIIKKDGEYQQENGESNVFCQSYDQLSLKHLLALFES